MGKIAEEKATETVVADLNKSGLSTTPDLVALIAAAVASAVKEAKRDEKQEKIEAQQEADRERVHEEERARVAAIRARQDSCPHLDSYENYAFVGQRNCAGQLVFLCSQCFRPFKPGDADYSNFVRFVKLDRIGNARLNM